MSEVFKCLADNTEHPTLTDLHAHLRKLKIKQADYYERFYPRYDILTGEKIPFKDLKNYFNSDFLNKINANKWCNLFPEKGIEWGKSLLEKRAKEKNVMRAFHHVELRSLGYPNVRYFEKYGNYNEICKSINLTPIFTYTNEFVFKYADLDNKKIICDTREQKPIKFSKNTILNQKLEYGDYALETVNNPSLYIEKKSLNDFVGSFGKDYERLWKEMKRCKDNGHYLVVLVLASISEAMSFNYSWQKKFLKTNPEYIFSNVRQSLRDFDNLQFLFIKEEEAESICLKLMKMDINVKNKDLQFCYESKYL